MNKLLICADDFGLTSNINISILKLVEMGKVHATSVMFNKNYEADIENLSKYENLHIGCHFYLTTLPLLNNPKIKLQKPLDIYYYLLTNKKILIEEFKLQLSFLEQTIGRKVDYIDSHQYIFIFPFISNLFLNLIQNEFSNYQIKLPLPLEPNSLKTKMLYSLSKYNIEKHKLNYIDALIGINDFTSNGKDFFIKELTNLNKIPDNNFLAHYSTHPCENPNDIKGIDTLIDYRISDYKLLEEIKISEPLKFPKTESEIRSIL